MEMHRGVEKAADKMETASRFTERVLAHGNGVEVLSMKKPIVAQLMTLLENMPRVVTDVGVEFRVDPAAFAVALLTACGHLRKTGTDENMVTMLFSNQVFSVAGPVAWNSLPWGIRSASIHYQL